MAGFDADSPNVANLKQQSDIVFIVYNYDPRFFFYDIVIIRMIMMVMMIIDSDEVDYSNKR